MLHRTGTRKTNNRRRNARVRVPKVGLAPLFPRRNKKRDPSCCLRAVPSEVLGLHLSPALSRQRFFVFFVIRPAREADGADQACKKQANQTFFFFFFVVFDAYAKNEFSRPAPPPPIFLNSAAFPPHTIIPTLCHS